MAEITVVVRHADRFSDFKAFEDMAVWRFFNEHIRECEDLAPIGDKRLYHERTGDVVEAGDKLQSYISVGKDGVKFVSFILGPPPIAPSAAVGVGAPSVVVPAKSGAGDSKSLVLVEFFGGVLFS
jgi:hypothetical protein